MTLGPMPPSTMLQPGYMWARYYVKMKDGSYDYSSQSSGCPPDLAKTYGCTVYKGYGWGQMPVPEGDVHAAPAIPTVMTTTPGVTYRPPYQKPIPIVPTYTRDQCKDLSRQWLHQHPMEAKCLTKEDKKKLVEICLDIWNRRKITEQEGFARADRVVRRACKRKAAEEAKKKAAAPAPSSGGGGGGSGGAGDPGDDVARCEREIEDRVSTLPGRIRDCIMSHPTALEELKQICVRQMLGEISPESAAAEADEVIAEACEDGAGGHATPPGGHDPHEGDHGGPEMPPVEDEALDEIEGTGDDPSGASPGFDGGDGSGDTAPLDLSQEKPSLLRRWGPVVGVMLLVGGGIYMLRPRTPKG